MAKSKSAFEKKDAAYDKKKGIKENSPSDMKMDAKMMKSMGKAKPAAKSKKK